MSQPRPKGAPTYSTDQALPKRGGKTPGDSELAPKPPERWGAQPPKPPPGSGAGYFDCGGFSPSPAAHLRNGSREVSQRTQSAGMPRSGGAAAPKKPEGHLPPPAAQRIAHGSLPACSLTASTKRTSLAAAAQGRTTVRKNWSQRLSDRPPIPPAATFSPLFLRPRGWQPRTRKRIFRGYQRQTWSASPGT